MVSSLKTLNLEFCCVLTDLLAGVELVTKLLATTLRSLFIVQFFVPFMELIAI